MTTIRDVAANYIRENRSISKTNHPDALAKTTLGMRERVLKLLPD